MEASIVRDRQLLTAYTLSGNRCVTSGNFNSVSPGARFAFREISAIAPSRGGSLAMSISPSEMALGVGHATDA